MTLWAILTNYVSLLPKSNLFYFSVLTSALWLCSHVGCLFSAFGTWSLFRQGQRGDISNCFVAAYRAVEAMRVEQAAIRGLSLLFLFYGIVAYVVMHTVVLFGIFAFCLLLGELTTWTYNQILRRWTGLPFDTKWELRDKFYDSMEPNDSAEEVFWC